MPKGSRNYFKTQAAAERYFTKMMGENPQIAGYDDMFVDDWGYTMTIITPGGADEEGGLIDRLTQKAKDDFFDDLNAGESND
jgi:hypothetical protein